MSNKIIWGIFFAITALLFGYILIFAKLQPAGDIAEYFGITESILNHGSIELTQQDEQNLSKILHPAYFKDPQYYIAGKDGKRYPVHFPLYSFLAVPVRVILISFQLDELKTLAITNLVILAITSFIILRKFLGSPFQKIVFLSTFYLSPIISFVTWPGPDLFYVCMLLLTVFYFYKKQYFQTVIFSILASWHSQPLIIIALAALANYFISEVLHKKDDKYYLALSLRTVIVSGLLLFLIFIPYLLNLTLFGLLTPWTIIANGWTTLNGFGIQNMSLQKFFEQFFDLNMGLFWYAPLIFIAGCFYFFKSVIKDKKELLVLLTFIVTAFFYQTNPAWHYGTAGYGPTRHVLFILPFLIYIVVKYLKVTKTHAMVLLVIVASQFYTLSLNGFVSPKFENTLYNSPYASFVLDRYPWLYNPTPEIFVDRTNHTDLDHITSAVYISNGLCKKAYVLKEDIEYVREQCGFIPKNYEGQFEGNYVNY